MLHCHLATRHFPKACISGGHSSARHRRFFKDLRHVATDSTQTAALTALLSFTRVCGLLLYATHSKYPHRRQSGGSEILGGDQPAVGSVARDHARSEPLLGQFVVAVAVCRTKTS